MKILSLNTLYGGELKDEITSFFQTYNGVVDIFCLQEAFSSLDAIIEPLLELYTVVHISKRRNDGEFYHNSILIRKGITLHAQGTLLQDMPELGLGQWVEVEKGEERYWICNFHGQAHPGEKGDTPERLLASKILIEEGDRSVFPRIVMGDFNLLETTKSVGMFAKAGYRNLIKEYQIPTTRNIHVWKRFPENKQMHSDYAFVKDGIRIDAFTVLPDIVSDHQPLLLEVRSPESPKQ